jgi:hypothetical protein
VLPNDSFEAKYREHCRDMQKVMEVYDLKMNKAMQLAEFRANHCPEGFHI